MGFLDDKVRKEIEEQVTKLNELHEKKQVTSDLLYERIYEIARIEPKAARELLFLLNGPGTGIIRFQLKEILKLEE